MRQQCVLLGGVETMDFVDKQNRFFAVHGQVGLGSLHSGTDIFDTRRGGVKGFKGIVADFGNDVSQRGFAAARRAVQNHIGKLACLNHAAQHFAAAQNVVLTQYFVHVFGAHAAGQRTGAAGLVGIVIIK